MRHQPGCLAISAKLRRTAACGSTHSQPARCTRSSGRDRRGSRFIMFSLCTSQLGCLWHWQRQPDGLLDRTVTVRHFTDSTRSCLSSLAHHGVLLVIQPGRLATLRVASRIRTDSRVWRAAEDWTQLTRTHILTPSNADVWHLVPNSVERPA